MKKAKVVSIEKDTNKIWEFYFRCIDESFLDFIPGQLVQIGIPHPHNPKEHLSRTYSVCKHGDDLFSILVSRREEGLMSEYLFKDCKVGDEITYRGPLGHFTLPDLDNRDLVCIATGSGIAPFVSMQLEYLYFQKFPVNIRVFHGNRTLKETPYYYHFQFMSDDLSKFEYHLALSQEKKRVDGKYVQDLYRPYLESCEKKPYVMICGNPNMVRDAVVFLKEQGYVPEEDFKIEIYT